MEREGETERVGEKRASVKDFLSVLQGEMRVHTHTDKLTLTLQLRKNSSGEAGDKTQQFPIAQSPCNGKNCLPHVPY